MYAWIIWLWSAWNFLKRDYLKFSKNKTLFDEKFVEDRNSSKISLADLVVDSLPLLFSSLNKKSGVDLLWWIDGAMDAAVSVFVVISCSTKLSKSSILLFLVEFLEEFWFKFGGNIELNSSSKFEQVILLVKVSLVAGTSINFCWREGAEAVSISVEK